MPRFAALLLSSVLVLFVCAAHPQPAAPCSAPAYHQLDFWIGDWDVFEAGGSVPVAHVTVDRILDGCVLHESYEDTEGHRGQSFSSYDSGRGQWRQSWYTNRGKSLELLGGLKDGSVILAGTDFDSTPQSVVRGTWQPRNGSVQETAVISDDGGKTWKPWFDLSFRPAQEKHSSEEDRKTIISLDAQYQAAVKANDTATIERLLPEGFILMSSTGKTYTRDDILSEARSGAVTYETQDDSDQVVHVYGETAVITAKLHAKGTQAGKPFDYALTFSDTYARTPAGWRYVFGQAGCRSNAQ